MLDPADFPQWQPMLAEMQKQSQRMTRLVEDLLTLSRLESRDSLPEEPVAMAPMLATLRREGEAYSQGRHAIEVHDSAGCDLLGSTQ
jgi:two-component system phosphate regulon sensor histidine kinase PhoR